VPDTSTDSDGPTAFGRLIDRGPRLARGRFRRAASPRASAAALPAPCGLPARGRTG
jgi:hypothetical protein